VRHEPELERTRALALAERLRDLRAAKGMTQEQAAQAAGMDRNHYQLLESGLSDRKKKTPANPRLSTLAALCRVFDTTVPALVIDIFRAAPDDIAVEYEDRGH
jgi:transcriptional regulator with XRE-family HTH domain